MSQPVVQASYMKNVLAALERMGAEGEAVRAADPELFAEIRRAPRLEWLPIAWNVRLVEAVEGALGPGRGLELLTACIHAQLDAPLWKHFTQGAVRLFGLRPDALVRWLPRAFGVVFRNCGEWRVARTGEGAARLEVRDLPPELATQRRWIESMAAGCDALFLLCRVRGSTRLVEHDPAAGSAGFELRWEPAPRRDADRADAAS